MFELRREVRRQADERGRRLGQDAVEVGERQGLAVDAQQRRARHVRKVQQRQRGARLHQLRRHGTLAQHLEALDTRPAAAAGAPVARAARVAVAAGP